ncbi:MAG: hypothetical protein GY940_36400 [bacterium]|nr:hypothetical protein [bacterium]
MVAVEFETYVRNGIIKVPDEYRGIAEGELKIIILKQEMQSEIPGKRNREISGMKELLKQIRDKDIFQSISDPLDWQRTIRDEWA